MHRLLLYLVHIAPNTNINRLPFNRFDFSPSLIWLNDIADDPKKTEHLRALDGATERLHLFKANLLEEGSFDAAIDGCEGVFHTASPFYHAVTDPQVHSHIISILIAMCWYSVALFPSSGLRRGSSWTVNSITFSKLLTKPIPVTWQNSLMMLKAIFKFFLLVFYFE